MILSSMNSETVKDLSASGRYEDCLQACQKLLQREPEHTCSWKYAGKSLLALGQFEKAQQYLTKAHQLDSSDPETAKDIGNSFLNLGDKNAASQWYEKSLTINNNYSPAINNLANLKRLGGNNQEAVDLFKRAIQADPQLVQAYIGAAASSLALGDLDQAQSIATQAIAIHPKVPGINEILGIIFQNKKKFRQAVESYQKELTFNPQSNTSLLNLGLLLLEQGEATAAIEPLARAAATNPSEQCSLLLAQAYQSIGNLKEAISEYQKIDVSKTQNKIVPFNLGLCLLNTGNNIKAIEAFEIAIEIDHSFLPAWGNVGTALANEGRHQEALPVAQKVLQLDPNNPNSHMNLGIIYKNLGNLDLALASTLKSLEFKPNNPDALINLGGIYKDLSKVYPELIDNSIKAFSDILKIDPNKVNAKLGLDQARGEIITSEEVMTINNTKRTNAFHSAISSAIKGGEHVIELGKSTGIYSMFAADKGAQSATKIVESETIKSVTEAAVERNNHSDKVAVVIHKSRESINTEGNTLKADLIITDLLSITPYKIKSLQRFAKQSQKFKKKNGIAIPESVEIKGALLGNSAEINNLLQVATVNGYDLSIFNEISRKNHIYKLYDKPNTISNPVCFRKFDFMKYEETEQGEESTFMVATASQTCIGIAIWSKLNLFDGITYEDDPTIDHQRNYSIIFLFDRPFKIKSGQTAIIKYLLSGEMGTWFEFIDFLDDEY